MTYVRRDVWSLPAGDTTVQDYAKAVGLMMSRPATDPTSWAYQAAIHGSYTIPPAPLWNQCEHASWYFLPWHRMFLWYFEEIVRAAVVAEGGSAAWALPYWNYGLGGNDATIPLAFRDAHVNGAANPLYTAKRAAGINEAPARFRPRSRFPSRPCGAARSPAPLNSGAGMTAQRSLRARPEFSRTPRTTRFTCSWVDRAG